MINLIPFNNKYHNRYKRYDWSKVVINSSCIPVYGILYIGNRDGLEVKYIPNSSIGVKSNITCMGATVFPLPLLYNYHCLTIVKSYLIETTESINLVTVLPLFHYFPL